MTTRSDSESGTLLRPFMSPAGDDTTYRPIIVWAMNDRLEAAELSRQIVAFKRCGYGGIMVMPWGGLPYEFMSDEWLDHVAHILACAREQELEVWLWDDWIFGSGCAGGVLTAQPEYRASCLTITVDAVIEPGETLEVIVPPRVVSAGCFPVDKYGNPSGELTPLRAPAGERIALRPERRSRLVVVCWQHVSGMQHTTRSHGHFLDPQTSDRECDIYTCDDPDVWSVDMLNPEATRRYLELIHARYYERLEEHFGHTLKGFFYDEAKTPTLTPWTPTFAERFQQIKGYDVTEQIALALVRHIMDAGDHTGRLQGEAASQVLADYRDVWTSLLAESFHGVVRQWCQEHGVVATGHPIGDNGFDQMYSIGGLYLKNLEQVDMPGCDTVWGQIKPGQFCDFSRFPGSRAACLGNGRAMSETFAVYGHGLYLDEMRYVCEHQISRGVNMFFVKLSNYNRERSLYYHPPELSEVNPIIEAHGPLFCDRVEGLALLMNGGGPGPLVAVYLSADNYYRRGEAAEDRTTEVVRTLTYNQIEIDYIWDGDVSHLGVDDGALIGGSGRRYVCAVIPRGSGMPSDTVAHLEDLARQGGRIVRASEETAASLVEACQGESRLFKAATADVPVAVRCRVGETGDHLCLFLSESDQKEALALEVCEQGSLGEARGLETRVIEMGARGEQARLLLQGGPGDRLELDFAPGESRLVLFQRADGSAVADQRVYDEAGQIEIDQWRIEMPDGRIVSAEGSLPEWRDLGLGEYVGEVAYHADFPWDSDVSEALLSLGEVRYAATVALDGRDLGPAVFQPFSLAVQGLERGLHTLTVRVLNTSASAVFGSEEGLEKLKSKGAFKGTYFPLYERLDRSKTRCGLFGPVGVVPAER